VFLKFHAICQQQKVSSNTLVKFVSFSSKLWKFILEAPLEEPPFIFIFPADLALNIIIFNVKLNTQHLKYENKTTNGSLLHFWNKTKAVELFSNKSQFCKKKTSAWRSV
jgi:hypothetical protein